MTSVRARFAPVLGLVVIAAGCGDNLGAGVDAGPDDVCIVAPGTGVSFDAEARLCDRLSSYRFFVGALAELVPNEGVVPYDLTSPLFSDYARKARFVWLPEGETMQYRDTDALELPPGAVVLKSFAYPDDMREPDGPRQLLETRMLYRTAAGWEGITYVWNEDQTEALRNVAGTTLDVRWIHTGGVPRELAYSVPNKNQCKNCHEEHDDIVAPIGPKARYLNRDYAYPGGVENQLEHLARIGYLAGLPADPALWPRAPVWDDPAGGTVEERARAWLDINCAHCHNPRGAARTSGLDLSWSQQNPYEYGVCKAPIAAGDGSGGLAYGIVPGKPDESILLYRLRSTEPDVRMPEVGRQLVHEESVELIRGWILGMTGDCTAP